MKQNFSGRYFGVWSLAYSGVFWVPILAAFLRIPPFFRVPLPVLYVSWVGALFFGIVAAVRGSRWWWLAACIPLFAVWLFLYMTSG